MLICGIDPGSTESAYIISDSPFLIREKGILKNDDVLEVIKKASFDVLVIEMIASYGMSVGKEIFETCVWIGRFIQAAPIFANRVYRKDVKLHFCGTARAKDSNVRQALIDRFGEPGTKKNPGPLYGIKKDEWSALAIAVYWQDRARLPDIKEV